MLKSIDFKQEDATILYEGNQGAIVLPKNSKDHSRTKHIDIKYHYVRQVMEEKSIKLVYSSTENMIAEILRKGQPKLKFEQLRLFLEI